ncbi:hypothetical protein Tco_0785503 [Tanacetum coccineum]
MSQPGNDEFSQHLSDEESNHEDASDTGSWHLNNNNVDTSNNSYTQRIKLPFLKNDGYDKWAMRMDHYLEYIDNEVMKDLADEVNYSLFAKQSETKTRKESSRDGKTPKVLTKELECFNCHNTGHLRKNQMGLLTMDEGIDNWGEQTEAKETNHALMSYQPGNERT